jgi:hypothetical protein
MKSYRGQKVTKGTIKTHNSYENTYFTFSIVVGPKVFKWYNFFFSSYMALQPISGLGLLFMRFRNFTLIDS